MATMGKNQRQPIPNPRIWLFLSGRTPLGVKPWFFPFGMMALWVGTLFLIPLKEAHGQEQKLKDTQGAQMKVDQAARNSQERVTKMAEKTKSLLHEYRAHLRKIENTKVYNAQLRKLIQSQKEEMVSMTNQIQEVKKTSQGIVPLMLRMTNSLEEFIKLDVPFLPEERQGRLNQIKQMMDKAKVSTSEKFRRVLEAYQIENEYGRTIEAYRGLHSLEGKELTVDFLRVGRISLVYQTLDGRKRGFWDQANRKWKNLTGPYGKAITQGLRTARKQQAPQLMTLPVPAPQEVTLGKL